MVYPKNMDGIVLIGGGFVQEHPIFQSYFLGRYIVHMDDGDQRVRKPLLKGIMLAFLCRLKGVAL